MTTVVVLVTGSRFWDDVWAVKHRLDAAVVDAEQAGADTMIVRHGACYPPVNPETGKRPARSADWLAHLWCVLYGPRQPITVVEQARPADWDAPCRPACQQRTRRGRHVSHRVPRPGGTGDYCPDVGKLRNKDMIVEDPRPDHGIAFHRDNSAGTRHCIRAMREMSIPVEEVPYTL